MLSVVVALVKNQSGERGPNRTGQRRTANRFGHGKGQGFIGEERQSRQPWLLRVGQQAAQSAEVKHGIAGMISGGKLTDTWLKHAAQMLKAAAFK